MLKKLPMEKWNPEPFLEMWKLNQEFFQKILICLVIMLLRTATYCSKFFTNINLFKPDNDFLRKNGLVQRGKSKIAPGACGSLDCVGPSQEMTR